MAKGYEEMAEEDKAFADVTLEAQREILKWKPFEVNSCVYLFLGLSPYLPLFNSLSIFSNQADIKSMIDISIR